MKGLSGTLHDVESLGRTAKPSDAEQLHEQLQAALKELVTSEDWQRALSIAARFHDYSFANSRLIWAQGLARGFTPTRVAGYRKWQELDRQVRRGERGLRILAPVTQKVLEEEAGQEEYRVVGFRVVHVFDISQTDGKPLPEVSPILVEGSLPAQWDRARDLITEAGFDVRVSDLEQLGQANGVTNWQTREVIIRADLPGTQRFKTTIHELAHVQLHEPESAERPDCRGIIEIEAESVAFMVCAGLGIDTAGYSLPYVATWSGGDLKKVESSANRVTGCARTLLRELEKSPGVELPAAETSTLLFSDRQPLRTPPTAGPAEKAELGEVLAATTSLYQQHLRGSAGARALEFLRERSIGDEAIGQWQLGYAPDSWDTITTALRRQGFADGLLLKAGVVSRSHAGRLYDRMRDRLIFPVFDQDGLPRGFGGRLLSGDGPKYLNSPETDLYQKNALLYGMHLARHTMVETGEAIVVEGYTDAITARQAGLGNVVATCGTALTSTHLETLAPLASHLTLAFDGDPSGLAAAQRVANLNPSNHGLRVGIALLPAGSDPADLIASHQRRTFEQALASAVPLEHHLLDQILQQCNLDEPESIARAIHSAKSVVTKLHDPAAQTVAISHLAAYLHRDEAIIRAHFDDHVQPLAPGRAPELGRGLA